MGVSFSALIGEAFEYAVGSKIKLRSRHAEGEITHENADTWRQQSLRLIQQACALISGPGEKVAQQDLLAALEGGSTKAAELISEKFKNQTDIFIEDLIQGGGSDVRGDWFLGSTSLELKFYSRARTTFWTTTDQAMGLTSKGKTFFKWLKWRGEADPGFPYWNTRDQAAWEPNTKKWAHFQGNQAFHTFLAEGNHTAWALFNLIMQKGFNEEITQRSIIRSVRKGAETTVVLIDMDAVTQLIRNKEKKLVHDSGSPGSFIRLAKEDRTLIGMFPSKSGIAGHLYSAYQAGVDPEGSVKITNVLESGYYNYAIQKLEGKAAFIK